MSGWGQLVARATTTLRTSTETTRPWFSTDLATPIEAPGSHACPQGRGQPLSYQLLSVHIKLIIDSCWVYYQDINR
jgi:hypothetical protein